MILEFLVEHYKLIITAGIVVITWNFLQPPKPTHVTMSPEKIVKQGFNVSELPARIDVIVIGSGMGGMTTAAILAKQGKKVVVLEQHDIAGGNTHTFNVNGFEFDTGLHYVGAHLGGTKFSPLRNLINYISNGKIKWAKMDSVYDVACLENGEKVPIHCDWKILIPSLKKEFPGEEEAIDAFFNFVRQTTARFPLFMMLKYVPRWLHSFLYPLLKKQLKLFSKTTSEVVDSITDNEKLKGVFSYLYGDFGDIPERGGFAMTAIIWEHYRGGAYYPGIF
jgi:all-trans-retinol 13,14-reductase